MEAECSVSYHCSDQIVATSCFHLHKESPLYGQHTSDIRQGWYPLAANLPHVEFQ